MKKSVVLLVGLLLLGGLVFGQEVQNEKEPNVAVTIGILQGGGSLLGADFEVLAGDRVGFQIGAGYVGFGAGLNYHLKQGIESSMLSLQYWHQGVGDSFAQSMVGPTYIFRAKKLFTAQLGLGFALEEGPSWPDDKEQPPVMLLYSIGIYLPVK